MEKSLYDILEISKDSTISEVKKAYAKMIRKYPPEKFNKEFSKINSAYEILGNEKERYIYDQLNGYSKNSQRILDTGLELVEKGNLKEGQDKIQSFLKLEGEVPYVLNELAKVYELKENYKEAYKIQKKVLEKAKYIEFEHMNNIIVYAYRLNDEDSLTYYMKKAIIKFKNEETYFNLINLYIEDEKIIKAKEMIEKNLMPFLDKKNDFEGFCRLVEILFKIDESKDGAEYFIRALNLEFKCSSEVVDRLETIKKVIIKELNFKNGINIIDVLNSQRIYIERVRTVISDDVYRDNLGWIIITTALIQEVTSLEENNFDEILKKFLIASIKKRISINEDMKELMSETVIEYLELIRKKGDREKIRNNLIYLERYNEEIYRLDAKYLFDRYGGFIPYEIQVKNKKKRENSTGIFLLLAVVIIIALMEFL